MAKGLAIVYCWSYSLTEELTRDTESTLLGFQDMLLLLQWYLQCKHAFQTPPIISLQ